MRKSRWIIGLAGIAVVQLILVLVCNRLDENRRWAQLPVRAERRAEAAHDFDVETFDGKHTVVRARSGRFQLVHFWATWCPPCRRELPGLLQVARQDQRLTVWAVSTDREWAAVQRFLGGQVPAFIVRDLGGSGTTVYGVTELPDTYLIDPQGRIRARFSGAQNWTGSDMDKALRQLIGQS